MQKSLKVRWESVYGCFRLESRTKVRKVSLCDWVDIVQCAKVVQCVKMQLIVIGLILKVVSGKEFEVGRTSEK